MSALLLHPADAEERLGFHVIRGRLAGHARTPHGREVLAALNASSDLGVVTRRLAKAGEMTNIVGFDDPLPLDSVDDIRPVLRRVQPEGAMADGAELWSVRRVLQTTRLLREYLMARRETAPGLWGVAEPIAPLKTTEDRIYRSVDEQGRVREDASPVLQQLSRQLAHREGRLRETLNAALREAQSHGYATESQPTVRGGRAVIPIRAEAKRKVEGFVHDVSATGQTVYIEPAAVLDLNNEIRELELERGREVERILRDLSSEVRQHRAEVEAGIAALGHLDALAAMARLSVELGALVPEIAENGALRLVRARHPLLALRLRETEIPEDEGSPRHVVPLTLELGAKDASGISEAALVLTGPNAGGKSVAMKTVGLLSLMAAHGLPIPADPGTRIPLPSRLFVDLGDQQSVDDDLSTFTSHLVNLRAMLDGADDRSLCLIDEAGTGTDPTEGGALAQVMLDRLVSAGAKVVATTHHGALKAFAHSTPGVVNGSMQFDRATLSPTYRFQPGVPGSSYAFEIAGRVGIDPTLLRDARAAAGESTTRLDELVADLEARKTAAAEQLADAEALRAEALRTREDYERRLEKLRGETDARRASALAAAEEILGDANAAVERAVREIKEADADKEATKAVRERLDATRTKVRTQSRNVASRQKKRKPATRVPPVSVGPLSIGDQVRLDDAKGVGEIIELDRKEAVVVFGSLSSRVRIERLAKVGGPVAQRVEVRALRRADVDAGAPAVTQVRTRIDVRGARVDEVIPDVQRLVDDAVSTGIPSVEILHGKGTGALRQAIHAYLGDRSDVSGFEVAAWNQGGDGVTMVRFD